MRAEIERSVLVVRSPRVLQLEGLFDVEPMTKLERSWVVDLPIESIPWRVGLIVGPSGSGKSTIAHELFGGAVVTGHVWSKTMAVIDGFPKHMGVKEISGLLSSVGFSSPPSWLKPFGVLSTGEQFRVDLARSLAELPHLAVIDEFTSVVDRTVAQVGSYAVSKAVRKRGSKLVAVTCHYDVEEWLQPDWVYDVAGDDFRGCLRRCEGLEVGVARVPSKAWRLFAAHHYLDGSLSPAAFCFVGFVNDRPAVFTAVLSFPHPSRPGWREHRTVCLPDFQGIGLGNRFSEFIASVFVGTGRPYRSVTGHPAMIAHRARSSLWRMTRAPGRIPRDVHYGSRSAWDRVTASFEYVGPASPPRDRVGLGLVG